MDTTCPRRIYAQAYIAAGHPSFRREIISQSGLELHPGQLNDKPQRTK
jgi:hypothetical protein